jgi:hypothetical protein
MDQKMRWPQWYPTRADIMGILFALVVACLLVFVTVRFPYFHHATGFGPDWDCKVMPKGDPVCIKKPIR